MIFFQILVDVLIMAQLSSLSGKYNYDNPADKKWWEKEKLASVRLFQPAFPQIFPKTVFDSAPAYIWPQTFPWRRQREW